MKVISSFILLLTSFSALADVTFEFDYSESTEFNDATHGAARRKALEDAAASLGAIFEHNTVIQIKVTSSNEATNTLASAGSEFVDPPEDFTGFTNGVVTKKVLEGIDQNGARADGAVDVNFGAPWDFDDDVSQNSFDFKSTIIHELIHAFGFSSTIAETGEDIYHAAPGNAGVWDEFDKFVSDSAGNRFINETTFVLNGTAWATHSKGGASPNAGLFFAGPHAKASNGGKPVGIYSPTSWEEGSSGSHLDDENPALYGMVMLAASSPGPNRRSVSRIERAILRDLGYKIKAIPVPQLKWVSLNNNTAKIKLLGQLETNYQIQSSPTLKADSWTNVTTLMLSTTDPTSEFTDSIPANTPKLFYRAYEIPTVDSFAARAARQGKKQPVKSYRR